MKAVDPATLAGVRVHERCSGGVRPRLAPVRSIAVSQHQVHRLLIVVIAICVLFELLGAVHL